MSNVRGTVFIRVVKLLRSQRERSQQLVPARLQDYLHQRINVGSWYPAEHYFELLRVSSSLLSTEANVYELMGRAAAHDDMGGVYRSLLRSGDVPRTLSSLATLWRDQYDAGTLVTEQPAESTALVTLRDHELGTHGLCAMLSAYVREAATLAGGQDVRVSHTRCAGAGQPACEWRIAWRAAGQTSVRSASS